jgi:DNA-binding beta-propeller fold protein YncE
VVVINARTNAWTTNVPTATGAHSVAVSRDNNHIFVAVSNEGVRVYARTDDDDNNGFDSEENPGTGEWAPL